MNTDNKFLGFAQVIEPTSPYWPKATTAESEPEKTSVIICVDLCSIHHAPMG